MTPPGKSSPESILVVEDIPAVLSVVQKILESASFNVLVAANGAEAIHVEHGFLSTIDLLLSDVMMPDISGPELAKRLREPRPQMRVMLMSGYADGGTLILNPGWYFIQKPFLPVALVARVNDVLHSPDCTQGEDHFDVRK